MAIRALDFMTKVSSRFAYEILPVTTASVIGAMLVNHYSHQPLSPPIVIQAPSRRPKPRWCNRCARSTSSSPVL
jgi:hypothetical protein